MRIAYLFDRPLPATETDSEQAVKTLAALARRGHELRLVLPDVQPSDAEAIRRYYQVRGDFELVHVPSPLGGWSTGRKWWHAFQATTLPALQDVDAVYTRNFPTLLLAARSGRPFAYETYRPWMDQFPALRGPFRRAMRHPGFLGAVLHSELARERYQALGVDPERLQVVHNGFDPTQFQPRLDKHEARRRLGLAEARPLVTYTGHVNGTKGLDVVLAMARRLPHVDFALVGSSGRGWVELLARRLPNVRVVPWQPFDRVITWLYAADALVQPPSAVPLRWVGNTVLPMKLFLYMAAGRPIIAPDAPDVRELLTHESNAMLVPPGDAEAAAHAVQALLDQPARAARLAAAAAAAAQGLTWDARAQKIEEFIEARASVTSRAALQVVTVPRIPLDG